MIRLAAILLTLILAALPAGAQAPFDPFDRAGIDPKPGARVPLDLAFRDQTGARVTLGELGGGRPILLAPVLHDCPNICGVTMAGLARAIQAQDYTAGRDFAVVAFGIDPHEGPETARASLDELTQGFPDLGHGAMAALTGQAAQIRAVTDALGFRYAWDESIGQYAHVAAVAVLTADGRLARWLYGVAPEPTDLSLALTEAGEGRLGDWGDQLLLLCYHYDPKTGRYGSLVSWALRIGGSATVLAGAGLIGLAVLRERRRRSGGPRS
ncbi:SCO family protein [Tistrella mobilis]|uniref:Electron transporter SenC n=1 Tax=Tistrella mobilis TaxID=171437 RepID=A0A162K6H4_9PROT|nr:SCO family protein [Tistrella mobilis]KYO50567.1 electron transporter SenC [Tistrella mobilis]